MFYLKGILSALELQLASDQNSSSPHQILARCLERETLKSSEVILVRECM